MTRCVCGCLLQILFLRAPCAARLCVYQRPTSHMRVRRSALRRFSPRPQELHERYYEPRARVAASLAELLAGPPVKKLLFMTDPHTVDSRLRPSWEARARPRPSAALRAGAFRGSRAACTGAQHQQWAQRPLFTRPGWASGGAAAARACAAPPQQRGGGLGCCCCTRGSPRAAWTCTGAAAACQAVMNIIDTWRPWRPVVCWGHGCGGGARAAGGAGGRGRGGDAGGPDDAGARARGRQQVGRHARAARRPGARPIPRGPLPGAGRWRACFGTV